MAIFDRIVRVSIGFWTNAPALVKVVAFFLTWVAVWLPLAIPFAIALKWYPPKPLPPAQKLFLLAPLYVLAPLIIWSIAQLEDISLRNYGLTWQPELLISLVWGFSIGILGLVCLFGSQRLLGWIAWQFSTPEICPTVPETQTNNTGQQLVFVLISTMLLGLWISGTEELIFRGFLLNQLQNDYSAWIAASISSAIFAFLHLIWEWHDTLPQLPGLWLMGMVLVVARWVDGGSLGLAWGLHTGWIWGIAVLDSTHFVTDTGEGPTWLIGKDGKPLAGAIGLILLLVTGTFLWQFFPTL